jgi:hypothetical protein
MHARCDSVNLDGSEKDVNQERSTYAHAQKMRAAMTYVFGHIHGLGTLPWHKDSAGKMVGNPSVSVAVSSYMVSLRRRKVMYELPELLEILIHFIRSKQEKQQPVHGQSHLCVH